MKCKIFNEFIRIFMPRLVLEVFGSTGAIWGFSEAIGLRTKTTIWFWRPAALGMGFIFFMRWVLQVYIFVAESGNVRWQVESEAVADEQERFNLTTTPPAEEDDTIKLGDKSMPNQSPFHYEV